MKRKVRTEMSRLDTHMNTKIEDADVETEIVFWKFRTWLVLTVVGCVGSVPLMLLVVKRTAFLVGLAYLLQAGRTIRGCDV
jgi:hypothetical protein